MKRCDQMVRQLVQESNRIADHDFPSRMDLPALRLGVKRGKELVGFVLRGSREAIEQCGLARVRVPHQGDPKGAPTPAALQGPLFLDASQFPLQLLNPLVDEAPVHLELGLPRPAHPDPALVSLEVSPESLQSGAEVLELSQLDLDPRLAGARPEREDVENELAAVHHPTTGHAFEIADLCR